MDRIFDGQNRYFIGLAAQVRVDMLLQGFTGMARDETLRDNRQAGAELPIPSPQIFQMQITKRAVIRSRGGICQE